jgi:hypothetical protein
MAHLNYALATTPNRKKVEKTVKTSRRTAMSGSKGIVWSSLRRVATANRAQAVRAMHDTMVERARTSFDVTNMTHFDASMTEFEVIAKFMGISVEEAATL